MFYFCLERPNEDVCPKTHKYAYDDGKWCCQTSKDCNNENLMLSSECCQYYAYKQCPAKTCKNNPKGTLANPLFLRQNFMFKWIVSRINFFLWNINNINITAETEVLCEDTAEHCKYWEKQGYCIKSHTRYMEKHCKKSCRFCWKGLLKAGLLAQWLILLTVIQILKI